MHRFYLALSVPIALPGAVSLIWGENWITRRVEEKLVGCHLLQHSVVVMRLFCFVFLINGRQWLSRDCCLSFFLTEKKFKGWKKKKKKERVKKMQIEKDWEENKDVLSKLHFWHHQSETQFQQSCVTATSFRLWAILSGLYFQSFHALLSDATTVKPWLPTLSKSVIV